MTRAVVGMAIALAVVLASVGAQAEEGEGKPKPKSFGGQLSKIEGNSISVLQRGDSGERSESFTTDNDTKVLIETDQDETVPGEGGGTRTRPKLAEAKLSDLKVGQRVTVSYLEGGKAVKVIGHRPPKPRVGGEDG
jgi:hypothetical protein